MMYTIVGQRSPSLGANVLTSRGNFENKNVVFMQRKQLTNYFSSLFCRYSISIFIVPLLVLIVTYSCICREIWKSAMCELNVPTRQTQEERQRLNRRRGVVERDKIESRRNNGPNCSRIPLISRAKINTVKQTIAVIVMYVVCSAPFISAQLWATWDPYAAESSFANGKFLFDAHIDFKRLTFTELR